MASYVDISSICPQKSLRIIPFHKYSGPMNMALDFSLAQNIAVKDDPVLRFYGWDPACLSLGRHQDAANLNHTQLNKDGIGIVRRPTGGSAILHMWELTYSLIVAKGNQNHHTIYADFHTLLANTLIDLGYPVQLHQEKENENYLKQGKNTFACFNRPAFTEIKFNQKKVVGSAQKLFPNSVLQHGSVMFEVNQTRVFDYLKMNSKLKRNLADALRHSSSGLKEINSREINETELSMAIIEQFARNGVKSIYLREPTEQELEAAHNCLPMFQVSDQSSKQEEV